MVRRLESPRAHRQQMTALLRRAVNGPPNRVHGFVVSLVRWVWPRRLARMGILELLILLLVIAAIAGGVAVNPLLLLLLLVVVLLMFTRGGFGYSRGPRV